ncbi:copper resistance CopC/CopD family protein [Streptomyces otsuchiensis]|uniref:copper resistance CopC/CopD family protein n=1 Tax=Streptomyces otsuchiensis TaxID=2681388 RepID=UPI001030D278|nr:copper resistance protein CopC [Streptomyces otsuchiensis]
MDANHLPHAPRLRAGAAALLLAVTTVAALLLAAAPAAAHASLIGSDPQSDAVLDQAPEEVVLTFSEDVAISGDSIRVLDPDGTRTDTAAPERRPAETGVAYGVTLDAGLADGTYTVAWQVISTDSHPVAGAFTFSIGAPSETSVDISGEEESGGGTVGLLYDIGRYVAYTGYLLLIGTVVFVLACSTPAVRTRAVQRLTLLGWSLLTGATLALLLLRGPYVTGGGLGDAFRLAGLRDVIETKTGTALTARLLLLAAAGLFIAVLYGAYARAVAARDAATGGDGIGDDGARTRAGSEAGEVADGGRTRDGGQARDGAATTARDLAFGLGVSGAILALGLAATWAMAEHASSGPQTQIAIPADMLHMVAAAAWLGGLATLLLLLSRGDAPVSRRAVRRFSTLAMSSVTVLAVTGVYQSWRQVGSWDVLFSTSYGQLLVVKVALVALMLGVGWISRRWTARLGDPEPRPESQPEPEPEPEPEPVSGSDTGTDAGPGASPDPARAAQLARQREAVSRARREKVRDADPVRSGLRRSVLAEATIAVAVLIATTALTGTAPARTATEEASVTAPVAQGPISLEIPFDTGGADGAGTAYIDIDPGSTGDNTLHVRTTDADGEPVPAAELRVDVTLEAEEIGPLRFEPLLVDIGHWTQPGFQLPRPGEWQIAVTIRTSDIDQVTETDTFSIG